MPKTTFVNLFPRDFTLTMIELWNKAESADRKAWADNVVQPYFPFIIFERSEGIVNSFYDPRGIDWIKKLVKDRGTKEPGFYGDLEKHFARQIKGLEKIYRGDAALSLKGLQDFVDQYRDAWSWLEALWWIWDRTPDELKDMHVPESIKTLRENTQDFVPQGESVIRRSLEKMFPRLGQLSEVIRFEEAVSGDIPPKEILESRFKGYFLVGPDLYLNSTRAEIENKFGMKFEELPTEGVTEFEGTSTYEGRVKGKVAILKSVKHLARVKEGDILVSPMTLPDFLPAMKRAAAFVTDEGGLLCHAAIMSRELKKPCIIGTKIATKVLKDGDTVEVDAEKGIVKII